MINIVTESYCMDNVLKDFEAFFRDCVLSKDFEDLDVEVINSIDNAVLLDKNSGAIKTKFGVADISCLSTSCKIVLSYLFIKRNYFFEMILDVTECGSDALDILFSCVERLDDSETKFLLRHRNQIFKCADRDYNVNGHRVQNLVEGMYLYG